MELLSSSFYTLVAVSISPSGLNYLKKGCHSQGCGGDGAPVAVFLKSDCPAWPGVKLSRRAGVPERETCLLYTSDAADEHRDV